MIERSGKSAPAAREDGESEALKALRRKGMRLAKTGATLRFQFLKRRVMAGGVREEIDLLATCEALLDLERLAAKHAVADQFRPKLYWMLGPYPGNFGDVLTPYVLWHAFGVVPRWTPAAKADGVCIGSILKLAHAGSQVWGSGTARAVDNFARDANYAAVRGPLAREALLAAGASCPEIYGDPAVLLPELFDPLVEKSFDIGIIPHVLQEKRIRAAVERGGLRNVHVISLRGGSFAEIERVVTEIKRCRKIVSTSLHGVIVAHAYGVPAQSLRLSTAPDTTDTFKMQDYKASVGLDDPPMVVPEALPDFDWLNRIQCALPPRRIDTDTLRSAFPFPRQT